MKKVIDNFGGEYNWLSNFSPHGFIDEFGIRANTVEHYFQAFKAYYLKDFNKILNAKTPAEAKKLGRKTKMRLDWNLIRLSVMKKAINLKFKQNPEIMNKLLSTGNVELIEGNCWGDTYWGVCNGCGQNMLGKLLMELREELRNEMATVYRGSN